MNDPSPKAHNAAENHKDFETLERDEAMALWKKGRDEWNKWVEKNPKYNVNFRNADFTGFDRVSFNGFCFPTGKVSFSLAQFGDGGVNFSHANFGDGDVNFCRAQFGDGGVDFSGAKFGDGNTHFSGAVFGKGRIDFLKTQFGKGDVNFLYANFYKCDVYLWESEFGNGKVDFSYARLGGRFFFQKVTLGEGAYHFKAVRFNDAAILENFEPPKDRVGTKASTVLPATSFSFVGSIFDSTFALGGDFNCVPDLCCTKVSNHMDLEDLGYNLDRSDLYKILGLNFAKAKDPEDAGRLRRLKELAEQARHHDLALRFNADEKRAERWQEGTGFWASFLDLCYDHISDYGRSIWRPAFGLFFTFVVAAAFYACAYDGAAIACGQKKCPACLEGFPLMGEAVVAALSNTLPFVPSALIARKTGFYALFGDNIPTLVDLAMMAQGLVSFLFLFLIGLALRNRFRI